MTNILGAQARDLITAPLGVPDPVRSVGRSLWLYVHLAASANSLGHVCKTVERLSRDLGVGRPDVERWLARLRDAKLVTISTPPPYLVVKLNFWPGSGAPMSVETAAAASESASSHREVPVSSSKQAAALLEDGGPGEGEPLVDEIARVVGTTDHGEIRHLVDAFPRLVVLRALVRVRTTPAHAIRKSKLALFRYLLTTFDRDSHETHHTAHPT